MALHFHRDKAISPSSGCLPCIPWRPVFPSFLGSLRPAESPLLLSNTSLPSNLHSQYCARHGLSAPVPVLERLSIQPWDGESYPGMEESILGSGQRLVSSIQASQSPLTIDTFSGRVWHLESYADGMDISRIFFIGSVSAKEWMLRLF